MSTESKAREILAEEYERDGSTSVALGIRSVQPVEALAQPYATAIRAIERALAQPVVDEAMVERVAEAMWADLYSSDSDPSWRQATAKGKQQMISMARAALTAAGMGVGCGRG